MKTQRAQESKRNKNAPATRHRAAARAALAPRGCSRARQQPFSVCVCVWCVLKWIDRACFRVALRRMGERNRRALLSSWLRGRERAAGRSQNTKQAVFFSLSADHSHKRPNSLDRGSPLYLVCVVLRTHAHVHTVSSPRFAVADAAARRRCAAESAERAAKKNHDRRRRPLQQHSQ